jgi:hypothetical protein
LLVCSRTSLEDDAIATVGVKNLEKSKQFYERSLGLAKVNLPERPGRTRRPRVTFVTEAVDELVRLLKGPGRAIFM